MISNAYAAKLACISIYDPISPDVFYPIVKVGDDVVGIKVTEDTMIVVIQGTENEAMWKDNVKVLPYNDATLGKMHSGFYLPAKEIYQQIKGYTNSRDSTPTTRRKVVLAGHSRGAAIAGCLACLFNLDGVVVDQLFLFECPKFCYQKATDFLMARNRDGMLGEYLSTINGLDAVPFVPDIVGLDYVPPFLARVNLEQAPGKSEFMGGDLDPINWHLGETIYKGVQKFWPDSTVT